LQKSQNTIVFLVGSKGLIGSALATSLQGAGYQVFTINVKLPEDSSDLEVILDSAIKSRKNSRKILINCAWSPRPTGVNRESTENYAWIEFTRFILNLCTKNSIQYYGIGSCTEKLLNPTDAYTIAKLKCRELVLGESQHNTPSTPNFATRRNELNHGWFVPHYIYNFKPASPELVRYVISEIDKFEGSQKAKTVKINSNSEHDFVSLTEVVHQIMKALENGISGVIEIGSGRSQKNIELLNMLFSDVSFSANHQHRNEILGYHGVADLKWLSELGG